MKCSALNTKNTRGWFWIVQDRNSIRFRQLESDISNLQILDLPYPSRTSPHNCCLWTIRHSWPWRSQPCACNAQPAFSADAPCLCCSGPPLCTTLHSRSTWICLRSREVSWKTIAPVASFERKWLFLFHMSSKEYGFFSFLLGTLADKFVLVQELKSDIETRARNKTI